MLLPRSTRVHASASVAIVNKARNLGAWFDLLLNFNVHITKTCSLSFCSLYKIRRIRKYRSYKSAQTLILALVIGRLDYCNSLLYGLPASYIIKLQRVQNAAARPVKYRMMFKLAVYTFKALHGIAPTYIHQLIRLKPQSNYNLRLKYKALTARSAQQDQEDNRRQRILCNRDDPVERSSRRVESFGQSQNFYGTARNSLFYIIYIILLSSIHLLTI